MDRADAPPDAGIRGRISTRAAVRRRRCSVPRRAALAASAGGAVALARARFAARLRAAGEARPGERASGRPRGLVPAAGAARGGAAARRRRGPRRAELRAAADKGAAQPLGELFHERGDELQLAAPAGSGRDPRLRRGARGGPPRRVGPLTALLAPAGFTLAGLARARGVAAPAWAQPAPTPSGRSARRGIARP